MTKTNPYNEDTQALSDLIDGYLNAEAESEQLSSIGEKASLAGVWSREKLSNTKTPEDN